MNDTHVWMGVAAMASIVIAGALMTWGAFIADKHRPTS